MRYQFSLLGVSAGIDKGKACMVVDPKVIDVETGEIVNTNSVEARSQSSGSRLGLNVLGFRG